jgi:anti-sigma regulatory factor (Ser/Thr protein kinase)
MATGKISFRLKNQASELNALCDHLEGFCHAMGLDKKYLFEINLALDELFTNIISYGYEDKKEHAVRIEISCLGEALHIRIEDDGRPFNPTTAEAPNVKCILEDRDIGGLGIFLIKKVMDKIVYRREKGKNVLILVKKVGCKTSQAPAGDRNGPKG